MRQAVHDVTILRRTGVSTDAGGRSTPIETEVVVRGHVSEASVDAIRAAAAQGVQVHAVAAVPPGTEVSDADRVVLAGLPGVLDGTYKIQSIRSASTMRRKNLRLFLQRTDP